MDQESENPRRSRPEIPLPHPGPGGRRIVRRITQGTLLAVGLAAAQLGWAEDDPRFPIFSRTLVDRLKEPITRYHE
jgi:hypothetical protein